MENIQRELLINWWNTKFFDVLDRRQEDVFNFVFITGANAKMALFEALTTGSIDEALDKTNAIIEEMSLKYGEAFIEAKKTYIQNMFLNYSPIEGGRK